MTPKQPEAKATTGTASTAKVADAKGRRRRLSRRTGRGMAWSDRDLKNVIAVVRP